MSRWELVRHNARIRGPAAYLYAFGLAAPRLIEYDAALSFLNELPSGARLLDVGSGSSIFDSLLAHRGHRVSALDLVRPALRRQKGRHEARLEAIQGDALNLPFSEASFDAAISISALEHMGDGDCRAVAEMARVVRPAGLLVINVPFAGQTYVTRDVFLGIPVWLRWLLGRERLLRLFGRLGVMADRDAAWSQRHYDETEVRRRLVEPSGCVLEKSAVYWSWPGHKVAWRFLLPIGTLTPLELLLSRLMGKGMGRLNQSTGGVVLKLRRDPLASSSDQPGDGDLVGHQPGQAKGS